MNCGVGFCIAKQHLKVANTKHQAYTEWKPHVDFIWHIANALALFRCAIVCVCVFVLVFFFLHSLLRWHDCVVNKREYLMFQTIYNHICKIELRANNKQGNYFSSMQAEKKNKKPAHTTELHWPGNPSLKRICMRICLVADKLWLVSFLLLQLHSIASRSLRANRE